MLPPLTDGSEQPRDPVARLELDSDHGHAELVADRAALASGLLLGRYDRCEAGGDHGPLGHRTISRVHALLFEHRGGWFVADSGSTNGVWRGGARIDQPQPLRDGDVLHLGRVDMPGAVRVRWTTT